MRFAFGTFFLCVAISCLLAAVQMIGAHWGAVQPAKAEYVSTFNEQLALSPDMFPAARKGDRLEINRNADLEGGVLTDDARRVNAVMFLQKLGCDRLRQLGGTEQCP